MTERILRHSDGRSFLDAARQFLLRAEASNNLILGMAPALAGGAPQDPDRPYLATVQVNSETIGCAARTPPYKLVITALPAAAVDPLVSDVAEFYGSLPGVFGPEPVAALFAERWRARTDAAVHRGMSNTIYQIERVTPTSRKAPGTMRVAQAADRDLVSAWIAAFYSEAAPPDRVHPAEVAAERIDRASLFLWEDAQPVSMASWSGKTPNGARINLVYTPPQFRSRAYASACVRALTTQLLTQGNRYCFLFADPANPASNRIYQRIGYRSVCDMTHYEFVR
jgi:RimJ/RimL family protein N-acetyltransferase